MSGLPDSQLLQREARTYRNTGTVLLKLAEDLYSAGADLTSKAYDNERQSECARISEFKGRQRLQEASTLEHGEVDIEKRQELEEGCVVSAIKAAKVLKQEKIITEAVQAITESDVEKSSSGDYEGKGASSDPLYGLSSDDISTLVCCLAAEILVKSEPQAYAHQLGTAHNSASSYDNLLTESHDRQQNTSITLSASPNFREERLHGFVTGSRWIAVNRGQHL